MVKISNQPRRFTISKDVAEILDEYKREKRDELIKNGIIDDTGVVQHLVLVALSPWLDKHPDLKEKYLLK
jgi:hypothetical protein